MDDTLRDSLLEPLLSPLSAARFMDTCWEQDVTHIERSDAHRYAGLLSVEAIESVLSCQQLTLADAQLSGGPSPVAPEQYLDDNGHVVAGKMIEGYRDGSTLVLSQLDRRVESLSRFCCNVQAGLAMRCQTNAYLSPAGQQGFNPHYDSHDVFILQVQGKKTFHFYSGGPKLPANHHRFDAELHTAGAKQSSVELSAGDALYIPRGVMHDAVAQAETSSLHITLGLFPLSATELLHEVLRLAETEDVSFRRSLTGRFTDIDKSASSDPLPETSADSSHQRVRQQLHQQVRQLLAEAATDERIDQALRHLRNDMALEARPNCAGQLSRAASLPTGSGSALAVTSATKLSVRRERWLDIESTGDQLILRGPGLVLTFRDANAAAVRRLAANDSLTVAELTEDDVASVALATLLAGQGLVRSDD